MVELQINSGIEPQRIKDYFEIELALLQDETGAYIMENCQITLEEAANPMGMLKLPRTLIRFVGAKEVCEQQQHLFRMRFLSAGG